jgi:N-acyl-L-homoserine lactone synthetase
MIQLITPDRYGAFLDELAEMHRLRYRIFKERARYRRTTLRTNCLSVHGRPDSRPD